jgi:hypothetical protein
VNQPPIGVEKILPTLLVAPILQPHEQTLPRWDKFIGAFRHGSVGRSKALEGKILSSLCVLSRLCMILSIQSRHTTHFFQKFFIFFERKLRLGGITS